METEDFIQLPASSNSGHGNENDGPCESGSEAIKSDSLPLNSEVINEINEEAPRIVSDIIPESMDTLMMDDFDEDAANDKPAQPVLFEMKESVSVVEKMATGSSLPAENGTVAVQSEIAFSKSRGVKRARITVDEEQPSVHVVYKSLPRESKQKLEQLLQQWSRWHSQSCSSSYESNVVLESGEETYFPALSVGLDKPSAVTFWVDNQTKIQSSKEFIPLDETSVPLYDRGYSLALTSADGSSSLDGRVEKLDTSRCFNCGSYSHALKDCPKPRDNAAVNNARKQHKSNRNQHPNSRNSTRYYQSSKGGKYDGLTPGALDAETRQLLGLGELDPPPWLNRMRELGYPPGYLDPDMEDQPSGITIFGEEEIKAESEEGEILDTSLIEPSKKMTVEFPGINAPIPENADERLWTPSPSIGNYNSSRSRSQRSRYNHQSSSENVRHYSEQRWSSRDLEDDLPPGCDPGTSPSLSNLYSSRYSYGADYDYNSRSSPSRPWSPTYSRSWSDRGRRSPLVNDGSPSYSHYGSYPYSSPR